MTSELDLKQLAQQCESEVLQFSGAIQSYGALIRLDENTLNITHASANLAEFIGLSPEAVLGKSCGIIPGFCFSLLDALPKQVGGRLAFPKFYNGIAGWFDVSLVTIEHGVLIEFERTSLIPDVNSIDFYLGKLLSFSTSLENLPDFYQILLNALFEVTGFDRLMVYQYHPDWSGEVIAELATEDLGSYLGQRYPASDIPEIARRLYFINPVRTIPDAKARSVNILSSDATPVDLSRTDLRSVSPMHILYLENMGVTASCSFPIILKDQLWGLIACHHLEPKVLSISQRTNCLALVHNFSLGLSIFYSGYAVKRQEKVDRQIKALVDLIFAQGEPFSNIATQGNELMRELRADGFSFIIDDDFVNVGQTPELNDLAFINDWLINATEPIQVSDHLRDLFPEHWTLLAAVSGMAAIKLESQGYKLNCFWFRNEEKQQITWAGNPNKPMAEKGGVTTLSPRRSFEHWIEVRSGYSLPWTEFDKLFAIKFRSALMKWLL